MDPMTELAKMMKERENPSIPSITTGVVLSPFPEIQIKLNEKVTLSKKKLIVAEHIYSHYQYVDPVRYLNEGDEVILIPTPDEQTYYLLDKVRRL